MMIVDSVPEIIADYACEIGESPLRHVATREELRFRTNGDWHAMAAKFTQAALEQRLRLLGRKMLRFDSCSQNNR